MAYSADIITRARNLYVMERLTFAEIGARLEVADNTVRRWRDKAAMLSDDWDKARSLYTMMGAGQESVMFALLEDFVLIFQATQEAVKEAPMTPIEKVEALTKLSDSFSKFSAGMGKVAPEVSRLAIAQDVLKRLADHIKTNRPDLGEDLLDVLGEFSKRLAKDYG